jgi:CheY-like chemotaxis protein
MTKARSLCFIDDDPAELARFKKAMGKEYSVGVGTSLTRALDDLEQVQSSRHVDLYVLDMYFPREGQTLPKNYSNLDGPGIAFAKQKLPFEKYSPILVRVSKVA